MDFAKKVGLSIFTNLPVVLVYLFLLFFPFGQLLNFPVNISGKEVFLRPVDLIALLSLTYVVFKNGFIKIHPLVVSFFTVSIFGLALSFADFSPTAVATGSLYLLRLVAYAGFFTMVGALVGNSQLKKDRILILLVVIALASAIFGWLQYIFVSDLRDLKFIGWDDHIYRMLGTFLDPGYLGLILVFGSIISINFFIRDKRISYLVIFYFLSLSILFTYSRAGYLAFIASVFLMAMKKKALRIFLLSHIVVFVLAILLLPRPNGEEMVFTRTKSAILRLENYRQSLVIIAAKPVFGVGFNTICEYKKIHFKEDPLSHSCGGLDSSILFLLATSGVLGFMLFAFAIKEFFDSLDKSFYSEIVKVSIISLFVHSLFQNSIFYPFVMGWFAILAALRGKSNR